MGISTKLNQKLREALKLDCRYGSYQGIGEAGYHQTCPDCGFWMSHKLRKEMFDEIVTLISNEQESSTKGVDTK